jgi:Holliday junction resolvase RusA-like endonuclease
VGRAARGEGVGAVGGGGGGPRGLDLDNALGACKPYFDSFTDLCIWQDDSGVSFVLPPATVDRENPGVTVTICEVRGEA